MFPAASDELQQGFVRVINHSDEAGEIHVTAIDDTGRRIEGAVLAIDANETVHFNSSDLEQGNAEKGLSGGTGSGSGNWRLELAAEMDIEVLSYVRTPDGFLTLCTMSWSRGAMGIGWCLSTPAAIPHR